MAKFGDLSYTVGKFHDWPDGKWHSISYAQHLKNMAQRGTGGAPQSAAAPAAPAAAAAAPAPPPPTPDPRDASFNAGVARLLFQNQNARADITQQGGQDTQDFNTMLKRMAESRAQDLLAQNYQANNEGLFYSGQLGKRRGKVEKDYSQRQGDAQTQFDRRAAARAQALDRLGTITADASSPLGFTGTGEAGLNLTDLFNSAVDRRKVLDADAADRAAALAAQQAQAAPAAAAPAAAPAAGGGGQAIYKRAKSEAHGGALWIYRKNAAGGWTPLRPA